MANRKEALREVQKHDFALMDAALFLDSHPKNQKALEYFNHHKELACKARASYEEECGPLTFPNNNNLSCWEWVDGPWPWEGEV